MAMRVKLICDDTPDGSIEIPSNPYPMYPHAEILNYIALDAADGIRHVFFDGPERVNASIVWKYLDHDFVRSFERFLIDKAKLGAVSFEIVCPEYIDFGKGKGENIEKAYYAGPPTLKDIITPRDNGLFYDIELPYMFVRNSHVQS